MNQNYKLIDYWTKANKGRCSLYTFCLTEDKNIALLDLFSSLNRGKLYSSNTLRGFRRKLQKLLHSISHPIAINIKPTLYSTDKNIDIALYPDSLEIPHLYANEPLVIFGSISELSDFTLFIQGRHIDSYFNIKKSISFKKAKETKNALQRQWALQQAFVCYKSYLKSGDTSFLDRAKNYLKPFSLKTAFK